MGQLSSWICCDFCAVLIASEPALICAIGSVAEQTQVVPRGRTRAPTRSATGRVLAIAGRSGPAALQGVPGHPAWGRARPAPRRTCARALLATSCSDAKAGRELCLLGPAPFLRASGVEPGKPPPAHFCCGLQGVSFWRLDWPVTCSFIGNSQWFVLSRCYNLSKELVIHCFGGQPLCFLEFPSEPLSHKVLILLSKARQSSTEGCPWRSQWSSLAWGEGCANLGLGEAGSQNVEEVWQVMLHRTFWGVSICLGPGSGPQWLQVG